MRRVFFAAATLGAEVALVAGVAGCNLLLDASDYAVGPGDGSVAANPAQDGAPSTSPDAGRPDAAADGAQGSPDGGVIGDPCVTNGDCAEGSCGANAWCTKACTANAMCGTNSGGGANYCAPTGVGAAGTCSPGCTNDDDCASYPSAACAPLATGSSVSVCSPVAADGGEDGGDGTGGPGLIGDPCIFDSDCASNQCFDSSWCTKSCTANSQCGANSTGQSSYCLQMGGVGGSVCVPSCTQAGDCSSYDDTFCLPVGNSATEYACGTTGGQIGDPCFSDDDCIFGGCGDQDVCTMECSGSDDTSCGVNSQSTANVCAYSDFADEYECFAGCSTDMDCVPLPDSAASCTLISGSYVCADPDATQLRVNKQRRRTRRRP